MYIPCEQEIKVKSIKPESVESFMARGGKIITDFTKKKATHKTDAQALLDAALGTEHEAEVIRFLASQGIEVL
jgi:hypothetical protein